MIQISLISKACVCLLTILMTLQVAADPGPDFKNRGSELWHPRQR
jgi:hypothetical protein